MQQRVRFAVALTAVLAICTTDTRAEVPSLDEFSPAFLGMYRKVMEIEDQIRIHADRYGVDFDLARAVCLYESGGNPGLASHAGAQGYFQVMPRTFRTLRVSTNIEAGIKYLGQMIRQFEREDRAIAAYNGGPTRVGRAGGLPLETLQYVMGVGHYRTVLKQYDEVIRGYASELQIERVRRGDDWPAIAERVGLPEWEVRLHNPFLARRQLKPGNIVAYPRQSRADLFTVIDGGAAYRVRHGDNYIKLAIMLGLDLEQFRSANGLWQLQTVPAGVVLRIPFSIDRAKVVRAALGAPAPGGVTAPAVTVADAEDVSTVSVAAASTAVDRDAAEEVTPHRPTVVTITHRVKRGETLTSIARRYGTTVTAIRRANQLRSSTIQAGQRLRIPRTTRA